MMRAMGIDITDGIMGMEINGKVFINLTPHDVVIYDSEGSKVLVRILASGTVPRIPEENLGEDIIVGIPVVRVKRDIDGALEELRSIFSSISRWYKNVVIILPAALAELSLRIKNLFPGFVITAPDTFKGAVRDESNRIIGVKNLKVFE